MTSSVRLPLISPITLTFNGVTRENGDFDFTSFNDNASAALLVLLRQSWGIWRNRVVLILMHLRVKTPRFQVKGNLSTRYTFRTIFFQGAYITGDS
ncbi:MAG: hypothetical protein CM15mP103_13300 [Gammaproteobacteria bacterium]|nr:MAG: hypothetical protein CM15mP103_13300 [Gammaproteobacteria bacterium]